MKLTIFFIIFICELIAIILFELIKLAKDIYTYKKANKMAEELIRASQDGIGVN